MSQDSPLCLTLELARARESWDPHAFASGEQSYLLREAGGVYQGFDLVWDEQLAKDLTELGRLHPDQQVVWRLGERLRRILLLAGWEQADAAIGEALRGGRRVLVDFISGAAELYALPWELVPLRSTGQRLAERPEVLLRYAWPATSSRPRGPHEPGGRLLFAWSDAANPVPWREHEALLREGVAAASPLAPVALEVLPRAGAQGLAEALARRPTMLHLLCHGLPGVAGGLALQGPGGELEVLDPAELAALIAPAADSLRLVVLCACGSGAWSSLSSKLGSIAQVVHRAGVSSVVAFRIPVSIDGANRVTRALYEGLLRGHRSLEDAMLDAQQALMGLETLDWAALQLLARAEDGTDTRPVVFRPYRGLLPFRREHRPFFFGRERVVREVVDELVALVETPEVPDLLFLVGPSGVGKSSLLAAGVLPALEERWPGLVVRSMRPGPAPLAMLEATAAGLGEGPSLLVIDQLEELFTQGASKAEIQAFAAHLWPLLLGRVRCIVAIRGDYMDRLAEVPLPGGRRLDALAYNDAHRVFIPRPLPEELAEAITRPAEVVGLELDEGLCERILEEVGQEPGALPLVQHAMDLLWQRREGRRLTLRAYEKDIKGLDGALSRHADSVYQALQEQDRALVRRLLTELVSWTGQTSTSTRRRLPTEALLAELGEGGERVVAALVDASLLVRDEGDAQQPSTLEIAHEALIRRWPTLAGWLEEGAEARAARDWLRGLLAERQREPGFVLRGAQLAAAAEMRERLPGELPEEILAFIEDSERVAREEAAREAALVAAEKARIVATARRARRTLIASGVVAVLVLGLIGWAVHEARKADRAITLADERLKAAKAAEELAAGAEEREKRALAAEAAAAKREKDAKDGEQRAKDKEKEALEGLGRAEAARISADQAASKARAAARDAEALKRDALKLLDEAQTRALALEAFSHDLEIVQRASALVAQDPTLAAVLLREVGAEDPMQIPGWADLAGRVLGQPLAEQVARGLPYPVEEILGGAGLGGAVLWRDSSGRLMTWRQSDGAVELVWEHVLDVAEDESGSVLALLDDGDLRRVCILPIPDTPTAKLVCEQVPGAVQRIEDVELDAGRVLFASDERVWWWLPETQVLGSWDTTQLRRWQGPILAARWDDAVWSRILVLTPGGPVRLRLDALGEGARDRVLRRSLRAGSTVDWESEDLYMPQELVHYQGAIAPGAQHAAVLRVDEGTTGNNDLWTFDLRPWRERRGLRLRATARRGVQALKDVLDRLNVAPRFVGAEPEDRLVHELSRDALEIRRRGKPTTVAYGDDSGRLELLVGYSSGAVARTDIGSQETYLSALEGEVWRFESMFIRDKPALGAMTTDGVLHVAKRSFNEPTGVRTWGALKGGGQVAALRTRGDAILSATAGAEPQLQRWRLSPRSSLHVTSSDATAAVIGWDVPPYLMIGMTDQSVLRQVPGVERPLPYWSCADPASNGGCEIVEGRDVLLRVDEQQAVGFDMGWTTQLRLEALELEPWRPPEVPLDESAPYFSGELWSCGDTRVVGARDVGLIAVQGCLGNWTLWDPELGGTEAFEALPYLEGMRDLQLSSDGRHVLAQLTNGGGRLWSRDANNELVELRTVPPNAVATLSLDGNALFEADEGELRLWSAEGEGWSRSSPCPTGRLTAFEPIRLPEGEGLAIGCSTGEVYAVLGPEADASPLQERRGAAVGLLQADSSGAWLLSQDAAGEIRLWSLNISLQGVSLGRAAPILAVAFSPTLEELAWLDDTGRLERMPLADFRSLPEALWRATDDCLDVPTRIRALGVQPDEASEQIEACRQRQLELNPPAPPPPSPP